MVPTSRAKCLPDPQQEQQQQQQQQQSDRTVEWKRLAHLGDRFNGKGFPATILQSSLYPYLCVFKTPTIQS